MTQQQRAEALFEERYGRRPDGVWAAPGRVNLIGEHTDYNEGFCLPIALPRHTAAAAGLRDDGVVRVVSADVDGAVEVQLDAVGPGSPDGWGAYVAGVLWALREAGHDVRGLDLAIASDVPLGAGLSSSASLEASIAAAASDLFGLGLLDSDEGRAAMAEACRRAENEIAGAPTGGMDQAIALRAREDHALLLDCRDGSVQHVPFDLTGHGLGLLVVNTNASHALVDGQYGERRASCEEAARRLGVPALRDVTLPELASVQAGRDALEEPIASRARHVVAEIGRVHEAVEALRADNFGRLGELFVASHVSMRDDFEISCAELDAVVEEAMASGALGARMTGGGFGGSAIVLGDEHALRRTTDAVAARYEREGWRPAEPFTALAAGPAGRLG